MPKQDKSAKKGASPSGSRSPQSIGETVACLLDRMTTDDVLFLARDEVRAMEITRALTVGAPSAMVLFCPGSDALPGESAPPTPANVGQRAAALRKLRNALEETDRSRVAVVSTGEAAGRLYPRPEAFSIAPPLIEVGASIDLAAFAAEMDAVGYRLDDRVDEPGEIVFHGQVIDVFPADAGGPVRIEVRDDRVASIRPYDAVTQLTTGECERVELGRVTEPELGEGATLVEHLPGGVLVLENGADQRRTRFLALAADAGRRRPKRAMRDICPDEKWQEACADYPLVELGEGLGDAPPRFVENGNPMRAFTKAARDALAAGQILLLLGTARDLRFLARRAAKALSQVPTSVAGWNEVRAAKAGALLLLEMPIQRGFQIGNILAIAAADLLGGRAERDDDAVVQADAELFRLGEIKTGDVIVHQDHGIAVIAGLEPLPTGGDAIVLRFAGEARRLVPIAEASRIWRYGAEEDAVTLDKLDGSTWVKRRGDVDAAIAESARGLAALAAERLARTAPALEPDAAAYERFSSGFAFTETADQARAIAAVREDMASGRPIDRLVVGDVGYGKTEVALRAAAIAALAGKQVALAAPTTVLARQHLETFGERFEGTGVAVAGLSRLSSAADKKAVKAGLADGSIRIVIGTGAVAGKGVAYDDLGLVIIDEEQRFGAADKERLRALGDGHMLTLSATPIPRTLQNALIGLQQMSVIATPPARRQPIRTVVAPFEEQMVRTALIREKGRGGQSFVVVPRIEDMAPIADRLAALVPELEMLQAHGKMPAAEIDEAMVRFGGGEGDVLLATNIIEAGLDVPRANTMLIWRADRFGLSQLHQLRGRVGRSARRGQVYLLTEAEAKIAPRTLARLNTLQAFDRLGAGFAISARDLDLRGAGDLLGEEQAGHVKLIGVDLYQHLLEASVRAARGEQAEDWLPVLNIGGGDGRLAEDWIPYQDLRIGLYARLSRVTDMTALEAFEEELVDRFGDLPDEARRLVASVRLAMAARSAGIEKVEAGPSAIALTMRPDRKIDSKQLGLTEKNGRYLLVGDFAEDEPRLQQIEQLLLAL